MTDLSIAPDVSGLEIVMDGWTEPFWQASAKGHLRLPHCTDCRTFRWPPGPFCPCCRSQAVTWSDPGPARLYSFTIVTDRKADELGAVRIPGLVEFADAPGVRIVAAIVGADPAALQIDAPLTVEWSDAANGRIPVFRPLR